MKLFGKKKNEDGENEGKGISLQLRQSWTIRLGSEPDPTKGGIGLHRKKKDDKVYILKNIDREDLAEDRTFSQLFEKLEQAVQKRFEEPKHYYLNYLYPGSPLKVNVDMDNHDQMMAAYDKFGLLPKKKFAKLKVRILVRVPGSPMFRTDKPKTVHQRLDNRNAINRFLAEQFARGRVDLQNFTHIMGSKLADAKAELYGIVPDGEREFHNYLIVQKTKKKKNVSPEDLYDKGQITIKEFEDMKFPELKVKREKMNADYPLPEPLSVCVICGEEETANIQCLECEHKACSDCVYREFTIHPEKQPFLLMHHIFCCKNGRPIRGYLPPSHLVDPGNTTQFVNHPNNIGTGT